MRRKWFHLVLLVGVAAGVAPWARDWALRAAPPKKDEGAGIMARKLVMAQKILEGIALDDLAKVDDFAKEMMLLSKLAEFRTIKTPEYDLNINDFRRSLEEMQKSVKAKNVDGAALAYVDMTMSCVRCHKHVREVKMARATDPKSDPRP